MLRMLQFAEPTIATSSSMMSSLLCTYTMKRRFAIACKAFTAWTCDGLIAYTQGRKMCKSSHIDCHNGQSKLHVWMRFEAGRISSVRTRSA